MGLASPLSAPPSATGRATALIFSAHPVSGSSLRLASTVSWAGPLPTMPRAFLAPHYDSSSAGALGQPHHRKWLTVSLLWTTWMRRGALSVPRTGDPSRPPPPGRAQPLSAPP
eukprot:696662-Heterocapsa_arctica.AAC.1